MDKIRYEQILDFAAEQLSRQVELKYGGDPKAFVTRGIVKDWTSSLADDIIEWIDNIAYHNSPQGRKEWMQ